MLVGIIMGKETEKENGGNGWVKVHLTRVILSAHMLHRAGFFGRGGNGETGRGNGCEANREGEGKRRSYARGTPVGLLSLGYGKEKELKK